jgi:hypothetical protein
MPKMTRFLLPAAVSAVALMAFLAGGAAAQTGKIVCWKDKAGKVIGCGDRVPPEYQDNATKELDKSGVTRKVSETAEERARRVAEEKKLEAQKAEEARQLAEQRRQDAALINTFSNEKEIDLKRDRDLQVLDTQLKQLHVAEKNAAARLADFTNRIRAAEKEKKPVSEYYKDEIGRARSDHATATQNITAKEKEMTELRQRYGEMKQRYIQLRGGAPASTAAAKK